MTRMWFAVVFLTLMATATSLQVKFEAEKYVILMTSGTPKGKIGGLKVDNSIDSSAVEYSRLDTTSLIDIGKYTGRLSLLEDLDNVFTAQLNNSELTFVATLNAKTAHTTVVSIVLPLGFGDQFVHHVIEAVSTSVKSNHILYENITPSSLLRFLRKINSGDPEEANSIAEVKIQDAIAMTKREVISLYEQKFGTGTIVLGFLHVEQLFSEKAINEIEREASCHETIAVGPKLCLVKSPFRTFDGTCNNLKKTHLGAAATTFLRLRPARYFDVDGLNDPIGYPDQPNAPDVPSPFEISKDFIKDEVATSSSHLTHAVMQIGQFLDHDIDLTADSEGSDECFTVSCSTPTPPFETPCYPILPISDGKPTCIPLVRSAAACQEKGYPKTRQQVNLISSFVDASQIYGPSKTVADSLRQKQNDQGLLRVSNGKLLPLDTSSTANQLCTDLGVCYLAGDIRSNEQPSLTSFHTLFVREHNRMARKLKDLNDNWDGERIYQEARKIMIAVFQKIVYSDYLPLILGPKSFPEYVDYDETINPSIANSFASAAYRFGHSTIRPEFDLLDDNFEPIAPPLDLRFMFFNMSVIENKGVEPILLGLVGNFSGTVDRTLAPGVTKHLFERKNMPGQNLAALNIQRARDHGLAGYNEIRKFCGLSDAKTFEDTKHEIKDPENRDILKGLYNDIPNDVELWIAGLAETPVHGGTVGPTFRCVIADQFRRTRDGDRHFYQRKGVFTKYQLKQIEKTSIARIYCDNVKDIVSIQKNAFKVPTTLEPRISCDRIPGIDFCAWKECLLGVPKFDQTTSTCSCECKTPLNGERCKTSWTSVPEFTPPFHIAADGYGDLGSRFVDLNGDGRIDQVFHRWINAQNIQQGAYLNIPNVGFVSAPQFTPPFHIAADGYGDLGARFVDLNGDGKIDFVYHRWINGNYQQKGAYLNTGNGWENAPLFTPPFHIAADGYGDLGARFIELNGDGKIDFVYHRWINGNYQQKGAYLNTGNGWRWAPDFTPPFHIAADGHGDLGARFVDLNGDGRMDMVYHRWLSGSYQQKNAYLNDGQRWVLASQFTPPFHIAADGHRDLGARFVDLNGDGKIDMVYHRWINGDHQQKGAYINNGYGWQWTPAYTPPFHISADGYGDLGARFADVTGDGLVDFVYHRWINGFNQQKNAFINTGCSWKNAPEYTPPFHIAADGYGDLGARFVDINGDGAVDLAYHRYINSHNQQKNAYLACGGSPASSCVANTNSVDCNSCCKKPRL